MDVWASVGGSLFGLDARYLQSQVVQQALSSFLFLCLVLGTAAEDFSRNGQALAEDQVGGGCSYVGLKCCADGQERTWKSPKPLVRFVSCQSVEGLLETPMETLNESIRLRMVWRRQVRFYTPGVQQLSPNCRQELRAIIGCNVLGDAKGSDYAMSECVYDGSGRDIRHWDRDWPPCESIYRGQQVAEPVGDRKRQDVDVPM